MDDLSKSDDFRLCLRLLAAKVVRTYCKFLCCGAPASFTLLTSHDMELSDVDRQ